jgi:acetyl-CoA carboxylase biotin carboxyl carrier protein
MAEPTKADKSGGMRIDPELVRELAELLTANELTEIEVEDGERKIKV